MGVCFSTDCQTSKAEKPSCPQGTTPFSQRYPLNFCYNLFPMRQTPPPPIHRESARWHCAARREITERSEEAPEAKAAQPSRNDGIWKALEGLPVRVEIYESPAGSSGGSAEGASEGRQPLTGSLLPPAAQAVSSRAPFPLFLRRTSPFIPVEYHQSTLPT